MAVYSATLSTSLVGRRLAYIATCSFGVLFSVVKLVMADQSSTVACAILANAMYIYMALCAVTLLYPP